MKYLTPILLATTLTACSEGAEPAGTLQVNYTRDDVVNSLYLVEVNFTNDTDSDMSDIFCDFELLDGSLFEAGIRATVDQIGSGQDVTREYRPQEQFQRGEITRIRYECDFTSGGVIRSVGGIDDRG